MSDFTRRDFLKSIGVGAVSLAVPGWAKDENVRNGKRQPNILLFFPDQHRHDWIEMNTALPLRTPNLKALAENGAWFTKAVCPSPLCAPSRAALASGKDYSRCGVRDNSESYPLSQKTFYTLLRDAGYYVTGCGKFDLAKPEQNWGADGKHNVNGKCYLNLWGFSDGIDNAGKHDGVISYDKGNIDPYIAFLEKRGLAKAYVDDIKNRKAYDSKMPCPLPDEAYADNWIANNGLELIRKAPKDKPWFLQVNFNGPHEPLDVTKKMKDAWKDVKFPLPNTNKKVNPQNNDEARQCYAAMLENIDRWVGVYIEELKKTGQLNNTLIVYSSDHGEMLGDHDRWGKSVPYQPCVGVPLLIAGPGVKKAAVYDCPATTLDLAATFLDYGGVKIPSDMDSRSFRPILEGDKSKHRDVVFSGLGTWKMVFDGRYKLITGYKRGKNKKENAAKGGENPEVLLFDLKTDPLENVNIADKETKIVDRLSRALKNE